eukprot:5009106-Ditylum_brightwellii.AAC.1
MAQKRNRNPQANRGETKAQKWGRHHWKTRKNQREYQHSGGRKNSTGNDERTRGKCLRKGNRLQNT